MTTSSPTRNYEAAVDALNSLQTNAKTLEILRKAGASMNQRSIPEMRSYVERIGYKVSDLNALNVIHVAGTKGKGSTSAICESIVRRLRTVKSEGNEDGNVERSLKTGLFTSPHLIEARERLRIDGAPIAKELFAKYFFEVWDALERTKEVAVAGEYPIKPQYFRFLTLMALHAFTQEKVDVAVLEVGMGGTYDSTNVIEKPVVCGITSLGFDHVPLLGTSLPEIAWHKAGIMKFGVPCYTVKQTEDTEPVLEHRARELHAMDVRGLISRLAKAGALHHITDAQVADMQKRDLGMPGAYQRVNGALAVALCKEWIVQRQKSGALIKGDEEAITVGLKKSNWPGRAQIYLAPKFPTVTWYLDGAHTKESMQVCADWYSDEFHALDEQARSKEQILIFNCTKGRDGLVLLKALSQLHKTSVPFSRVIFCTNDAYRPGSADAPTDQVNHTVFQDSELTVQKELAQAWTTLVSENPAGVQPPVEIYASIEDAVQSVGEYAAADETRTPRVLVTGSLYLIGGLLTVLKAEVR
ncbi:Folylpolyglutamate synthetase [Thoreauomyces humboldtii]|nr:Folylpolyglutamate synthetase [Thoreauomyces humboldtii]